jgi:diphthine-ammonia ligase
MKVVALFSGGKDSTYALFRATNENHSIVSLLTVKSTNRASYMYHLPNIDLTRHAAEAMGLPLVVVETDKGKEEELGAMYEALAALKKETAIEGVLSGAIASEYQKKRIEEMCSQLNLHCLSPLWGKNQEELLREMLQCNFKIMVVGVAAQGFDEKWLGRLIDERALNELIELKNKFKISVIGEGGEFETLVLDCPLFKKRIQVGKSEKQWDGSRGELKIKDVSLSEK